MLRFLSFIFILLNIPCPTQGFNQTRAKATSKLFLISPEKVVPLTGKQELLPSRVYSQFDPDFNGGAWIFVMSDEKGSLPNPAEILLQGSVLPGDYLGKKGYHYKLTASGEWEVTRDLEIRKLFVLKEGGYFKTVSIEKLGKMVTPPAHVPN